MPRGSHRAGRAGSATNRVPLIAGAVVGVLVLGVAAWFLFFREGATLGGDHPVADFSFELGKVGASSPGEAVGKEELEEPAEEVRATLDAMYVAGFVDPSKWEGGTFPEVLDAFSEGVVERAKDDMWLLSLGTNGIEHMDPEAGRLNIRFLADSEGAPTAAIATTHFGGQGELKAGGPVFTIHDGTYYLRPEDDGWRIVGYDVHSVVQSGRLPDVGPDVGPGGGATP